MLIRRKCGTCGGDALLDEVRRVEGTQKYQRVFVCSAGHEVVVEDGKERSTGPRKRDVKGPNPGADLSALEQLNKFLDELGGGPNA